MFATMSDRPARWNLSWLEPRLRCTDIDQAPDPSAVVEGSEARATVRLTSAFAGAVPRTTMSAVATVAPSAGLLIWRSDER